MKYKDYYKIMGVEKSAAPEQIKSAYRKLARKYHPDVSKEANAEEKFKELQEAHEVLKDPEKRKAYDELGSSWQGGQEFRPPPGWSEQGMHFETGDSGGGQFSDFFDSLFGGGFARQRRPQDFARRGDDLRTKIEITLEDAYKGLDPTISLNVPSVNQQGQLVTTQKSLKIKIPAGVIDAQQMRLAGQGGEGTHGAPKGDLYIEIHIKPHRYFAIEGRDVYLNLPIAPWEAALGTKIKAPTLAGDVEMKVPKGAKSGQKMRLKGRGLKSKGVSGDQYITFFIQTPEVKSKEQEAFYQKMSQEFSFHPRQQF